MNYLKLPECSLNPYLNGFLKRYLLTAVESTWIGSWRPRQPLGWLIALSRIPMNACQWKKNQQIKNMNASLTSAIKGAVN